MFFTRKHTFLGTLMLVAMGAVIYKGFQSKDPVYMHLKALLEDERDHGTDHSEEIGKMLVLLGLNNCPADMRALYFGLYK